MERTRAGETWYLLVAASEVGLIMEDWLRGNQECDIRLHRSKQSPSCRVIELKDFYYAQSLRERFRILDVSLRKK